MLDEKLEYEQYTCSLDEGHVRRLKYYYLKDGLSGWTRALYIVARHCMFDGFEDRDALMREWNYGANSLEESCRAWKERIDMTRDSLRAWCGFDPADPGQVNPSVRGWFRNYLEDCFREMSGRPGTNTARFRQSIDALESTHRTRLEDSVFPYRIDFSVNNYQAVTYDRVISNAIRRGPLKRYYLAASKDGWDGYAKKTDRKELPLRTPNDRDLVLKTTAAYLLSCRGHEITLADGGTRYTRINMTDIANWAAKAKADGADLRKYLYRGRELFKSMDMRISGTAKGNVKKISLDPGCLRSLDWQLVEETGLEAFRREHPGYVIYKDEGAGLLMTRLPEAY